VLNLFNNLWASSATARRSSQSFHHISSDVENLTEFKAIMKWACESSAEQDENSDQHSHSYHSFYLKHHLCQCSSNLQCNHQISISSWYDHLTSIIIRKTKRQKDHIQEFCNQNNKYSEQLLANNIWCLSCNLNLSAENRNIHFSAWSVSEYKTDSVSTQI